MDNSGYKNLGVSSSPHLLTRVDTRKTMGLVLIALSPAFAMNIYVFGPRALSLTAVCVVACVGFETIYNKIMKKPQTAVDLSAVVTGILLAFNLPSSLPYWMAVIGAFVAIVIVKQLYGGLGRNIANPAIVGRIVLFISFSTEMTTWPRPSVSPIAVLDATAHGAAKAADVLTGPTPLGLLKESGVGKLPSNTEMFIGFIGGSMGEVSALALLIGGLYLIWKKVISPITPVAFISTVFFIALLYYGLGGSAPALHMAVFHVLAGGVMLGAFFMATDYVTTPLMPGGKVVFGIGCGVITMAIRLFGAYPEGVSFAILLMNMVTPLIENFFVKRNKVGGGVNAK